MKKTLPIVLGVIFGVYGLLEFYIPHWRVRATTDEFQAWAAVLTAAAFILGGVNILQVTWPKIRRREADWQYKVILLASAAMMLLVGLPWHKLGDAEEARLTHAVVGGEVAGGGGRIVVAAPDDVMVRVGAVNAPARTDGKALAVDVPAGEVEVVLSRRMAGFRALSAKVNVAAGQVVEVKGDPPMTWGRDGRVFVWIYDHVFDPCNSTMFALLAFFVASAAFRAFRARNAEAALLLLAAILVMLGRAPLGRSISDVFPDFAQWLIDIPNNAGRRAIMMGAAIGAIATGLRVIVGIERSHLGSD
ncbi:MAG: hypothetical protein K8M05_10140 [Deltaproteobacteria bacterium]|nr:hypothetical protein [Kofleriaceae bacterium]